MPITLRAAAFIHLRLKKRPPAEPIGVEGNSLRAISGDGGGEEASR